MLRLWHSLADMMFPRTCAGCGTALTDPGVGLCWDCRCALPVIGHPQCAVCGIPVAGTVDHAFACEACTRRPPGYRRARAAVLYNALGRRLVTRFKYNHDLWVEGILADLLEGGVRTHFGDTRYDLVCPVPLHPVKRRERGYNQSMLLAARLARRLGVPLDRSGSLRRVRATSTQTRLTARQRLTNVKGAFEVSRPRVYAGRVILLVDDVMTTGATVGACARVLRDAGAEAVDVATVARGN